MIKLSEKNLNALNSKKGLKIFLDENLKAIKALRTIQYENRLKNYNRSLLNCSNG